jgi:hypothetical protein
VTEKKPHWTDEYLTMIHDCEQRCNQLTEWETTFIDSVGVQLANTASISPKQIEVLERVWERVTEKG